MNKVTVADLKAVKTHNPFTVNDIIMGRLMNIPDDIFNNYGSSMIFGHPQGPTGARCFVELIEELILDEALLASCVRVDEVRLVRPAHAAVQDDRQQLEQPGPVQDLLVMVDPELLRHQPRRGRG